MPVDAGVGMSCFNTNRYSNSGAIFCAGTALSVALSGGASAATIIQDVTVNGSNTNKSFEQFNSDIGTLNSVTIVLSPHANTYYDNPNQTFGFANFNLKASWVITSADPNAPVLAGWEKTQTSLQNHMNAQYVFNVSAPNQTTTLTSDLSGFIGSGFLNYTINSLVEVLSSDAVYGSALSNSSNGGIRMIYDFTEAVVNPPSAVPEPATWAMMITGFGLAGTALRRRNRALAPA